jgi:hypothetical protein
MSDRQEENIGNLKKLRAMIKKDKQTVATVNAAQKSLDKLSPSEKRLFNKENPGVLEDFRNIRKNVFAREEKADTPPPKRAMASKEGGPKTPTKLPKPKPKRPTETAAKKKKPSGVTFDTSGTLPGQTIKKSAMGRAVMKKRGGTFKGVF